MRRNIDRLLTASAFPGSLQAPAPRAPPSCRSEESMENDRKHAPRLRSAFPSTRWHPAVSTIRAEANLRRFASKGGFLQRIA